MTTKTVFPRLVLYAADGDNELAVKKIALVLGSARCCRLEEYLPAYRESYDYFVIGGALGEENTAKLGDFIGANQGWLSQKRVALFSLDGEETASTARLSELSTPLAGSIVSTEHIPGGKNGVDIIQLVVAARRIRAKFGEYRKKMPPSEVRRRVENILKSEAYLILGTGSGASLRGTTIGYTYRDGHVYAFCEGAEKFANILLNEHVALAFYRMPEKDGLQATGTASVVCPGTGEYRQMCARLGRDYERLMSLPFHLNGLDIKLHRAEYYQAKLRQEGYESKQVCYF